MPIIPHFSNECLKSLKSKDIKWPSYDLSFIKEENINIVVQINGKKRALLKLMPNIKEEELFEIICKEKSIKKYLDNKIIKRKIFIKNKLFNIIV